MLEALIIPRERDLGDGFIVRRALPDARRRQVGPFVFFDHMGPVAFGPGQGLDVRPHPHIGLATVTYLFEGEIVHRDSLGTVQPIRPGDVNWMTAGRGIVHSERTSPELRRAGSRLSGIQVWVALPRAEEDAEPDFAHHPAAALPLLEEPGLRLRLVVGTWRGERSPVKARSPMFYADAALEAGAAIELSEEHAERAAYVAEGMVRLDGRALEAGQLAIFGPGVARLEAAGPARALLFGGAPLDGPRHLYWNFVSSSEARIERAKADWRAGRFDAVPGDREFIPLPGEPPPPVGYP